MYFSFPCVHASVHVLSCVLNCVFLSCILKTQRHGWRGLVHTLKFVVIISTNIAVPIAVKGRLRSLLVDVLCVQCQEHAHRFSQANTVFSG